MEMDVVPWTSRDPQTFEMRIIGAHQAPKPESRDRKNVVDAWELL